MNTKSESKKVGAVLVLGGGIGGIQTSLDLAESGFFVYLVESSPAIGGVMAQLDKTFPTNDCSMCILSPKLVEAGRHRNIKIITQATVEGIEGEAGNFNATVKKAPRYIIEDKCTGCAECAEVCPVQRPSVYEEGLAQRKAIYRPYIQAIPNIFSISKNERPPCTTTCPINTNAQGYVALIRQKKFKEALALIREKNPLPLICGRVCTHPCETECNRKDVDEPIAIRTLKRFVVDYELTHGGEEIQPAPRTKGDKVAIIGSGPAGVTCAYDLVKLGYATTIFEALPVAGGMLAVGIPNYRLPKEMLKTEIDTIQKLGVEIKLNTAIGKDVTIDDLQGQGYKAIFIAVGAHKSKQLNIPGEDSEGVIHGTDLLRELNLGKEVKVEEKVAIIGGGNVAIDAARSAIRLGARDIFILYRRSREEMPASDEEIEAAEEEGVQIQYLVAPVEILSENSKVTGIKCVRMELGEPDETGRRRPIPIEGSEFTIDAGMVIPAIGQAPALSFVSDGKFRIGRGDTFEVDPISLETNVLGVFAGGDAVSGPATVIEAMADGRRASNSIDRYLRGENLKDNREGEFMTTTHSPLDIDISKVNKEPRLRMPTISAEERRGTFNEVELGFTEEMAVLEAERCLDCGICSECMECVKACQAEAIDHQQKGETLELNVGSIILAPGFDEFDARLKPEYGYGIFANVVTSIQFERMLCASGPFQGHLQKLSDGKEAKSIAFIQCVGSRDISCDRPYCSSVCCTYAVKEAIITKEHAGDVECNIFYIDMRTYGKGFDEYLERAKTEYGVRFIRCRVSAVEEDTETKKLIIRYESEEDSGLFIEEFDLVVLSVGLSPPKQAVELANKLGIELNKYGFAGTHPFQPIETSRPGILVCGAFQGPKDIPETVTQASGAAAHAEAILSPARGSLVTEKEFPPEIDITGQEPRIGAFICHCGTNIGGYVDVPQVVEYAKTLPGVAYAEDNLYTCSQDTQERIKAMIKEHNLNRVMVASCTPRTHEPLFQETIREAGLNPYLFEMANIRDQCSWVHMHEPEKATQKAKDLVRMAIARNTLLEPLHKVSLGLSHDALVIGGGVGGMTAALNLAEQGFKTCIVEREEELGGWARKVHFPLNGEKPQDFLRSLIEQVKSNQLIEILTDTVVTKTEGFVGNFKTTLASENGQKQRLIEHGVIIVATGAKEYRGTEFFLGQNESVLTLSDLEEKLANSPQEITRAKNIAMILCVRPPEGNYNYCSRVCCTVAIKNALKIKEMNPVANIYILYKDIRTYGFKEELYTRARKEGVVFIHYTDEKPPQVRPVNGKLEIDILEPILSEELILSPDLLVLATPTVPSEGNEELSFILKVPITKEGFFHEAHVKLAPVDFASEGIFMCGTAHSPKFIDETIAQAQAAAGRATTVLAKDQLQVGGAICQVDREKCIACLTCVRVCSYGAPFINREGVAEIEVAKCRGCGICAAECPRKAIQLLHYKEEQLVVKSEALLAAIAQ
ncbi:MAG TPA: FAD-dependent oxidoreductase [Dehalococcoidia bacterium]|nr:FAD-dependent oxidoreductase [Dehalococcoidia bacterium]